MMYKQRDCGPRLRPRSGACGGLSSARVKTASGPRRLGAYGARAEVIEPRWSMHDSRPFGYSLPGTRERARSESCEAVIDVGRGLSIRSVGTRSGKIFPRLLVDNYMSEHHPSAFDQSLSPDEETVQFQVYRFLRSATTGTFGSRTIPPKCGSNTIRATGRRA